MLVKQLLGQNTSASRRTASWEVWGKEHFPSFKDEFEAEFATSGRPKSERAAARNDFKLSRWKELNEETQRQWDEKAKDLHSAKKTALQDRLVTSGLMAPADAQKYALFGPGWGPN